jgi:hypothetical protein
LPIPTQQATTAVQADTRNPRRIEVIGTIELHGDRGLAAGIDVAESAITARDRQSVGKRMDLI